MRRVVVTGVGMINAAMESVGDQRDVVSARNASPAFPSLYARLCASDVISKCCLRHPKTDSQVVDVLSNNLCVIVHYSASRISTSTLGAPFVYTFQQRSIWTAESSG